MAQPSARQLQEFWKQVAQGAITDRHLQELLDGRVRPQSFVVEVNYDEPRWSRFDIGDYSQGSNRQVKGHHFSLGRCGVHEVMFEYVLCHGKQFTIRDGMHALQEVGLDRPNRAEAETFFERCEDVTAELSTLAVSGEELTDSRGNIRISCIMGKLGRPTVLILDVYKFGVPARCLLGVRRTT